VNNACGLKIVMLASMRDCINDNDNSGAIEDVSESERNPRHKQDLFDPSRKEHVQ
jgi:hypothetical protein